MSGTLPYVRHVDDEMSWSLPYVPHVDDVMSWSLPYVPHVDDAMSGTLSYIPHVDDVMSGTLPYVSHVDDIFPLAGFTYERLDGSVRGEERFVALKNFEEDEGTFVFLLSTRAGRWLP